jgi:predicted dehydrogenase
MNTAPVKIGIVGMGNISSIYLRNCMRAPTLDVLACADLVPERAEAQAQAFGVPRACTVKEVLADPEIELVVNLTIPQAHGTVGIAALEHGKSVYNEKPLALSLDDAQRMLALANANDLLVGGAPDTFLGAGLQTCRDLLDAQAIGRPVAAMAHILGRGPERWHPNPDFFYQPGAGPMFDMGPYYLTALITLLGPVRRVTGSAQTSFSERVIASEPLHGTTITVNTPTHLAAVLDFANGAVATLVTSFDVYAERPINLEIFGADGTLVLPDPNTFDGPVRLHRAGEDGWHAQPLTHEHTENSRGIGVVDMADALRSGKPHRANGALALHVLEIMHAIHEASRTGRHTEITSTIERPAALPRDWRGWNDAAAQ